MNKYFDKMSQITEVVNGKSITRTDISQSYQYNLNTVNKSTTNSSNVTSTSVFSKKLYKDPENFWALMIANEEINPWKLLAEDPNKFEKNNQLYAATTFKYAGTKNDPYSYIDLIPGDIIVLANTPYNSGITSASYVFGNSAYSDLPTWYVDKVFYDTKKSKITPCLVTGFQGQTGDIATTGTFGFGFNYVIIRQGATGNYLITKSSGDGTFQTLETYTYLDSPAITTIKGSQYTRSTFTSVGTADSLWTVIFDDVPELSSVTSVAQTYNIKPTKNVQKENYLKQISKKYIPAGSFQKLLNKLI